MTVLLLVGYVSSICTKWDKCLHATSDGPSYTVEGMCPAASTPTGLSTLPVERGKENEGEGERERERE